MITTVIIKTIGRSTLQNAINSAHGEGYKVVVIVDGPERPLVTLPEHCEIITLGRRWGYYGGMAANVGAALAKTPFITFLDDDDEFVPGTGAQFRNDLSLRKDLDILIAGLVFKDPIALRVEDRVVISKVLCVDRMLGIRPGNVAMGTFRTEIFSKYPYLDDVSEKHSPLTDFLQIQKWVQNGYKLDWVGYPIYQVRASLDGTNGRGI